MENFFYTIMVGNKFFNSDIYGVPIENIIKAKKFETAKEATIYKDEVTDYCHILGENISSKVVKVRYELLEM